MSNDLEERVKEIERRNDIVSGDKAWETSKTRKLLLTAFTYLAISLYLNVIEVDRPWINAIVPAVGFMISTLSMPFFKKIWLNHFR